jgi:nifR3 family TIM-barrel protein
LTEINDDLAPCFALYTKIGYIAAMQTANSRHGFWSKLKRPIMAQAPMLDVSDAAYRLMIAKHGKPDVMFTEFTSCDGLCSRGREALLKQLQYDESERPIVAQIFGAKPEKFLETARLLRDLGFDGIDINMGCPVKTIVRAGSCAALIKKPALAKEIIAACKEGAGGLPVSVKTRIGYDKIILEEWLGHLIEASPSVITLHLRTAKEMSACAAHWEVADRAVEMIRTTDILILGNGDVADLPHARSLAEEYKLDGLMLGRAMFGNPWLFDATRTYNDITVDEKLAAMLEHSRIFDEFFRGKKHFLNIRKHLRAYASGFDGAKELRLKLEQVNSVEDVTDCIADFRSSLQGARLSA